MYFIINIQCVRLSARLVMETQRIACSVQIIGRTLLHACVPLAPQIVGYRFARVHQSN
jgi:hypothetical protein